MTDDTQLPTQHSHPSPSPLSPALRSSLPASPPPRTPSPTARIPCQAYCPLLFFSLLPPPSLNTQTPIPPPHVTSCRRFTTNAATANSINSIDGREVG